MVVRFNLKYTFWIKYNFLTARITGLVFIQDSLPSTLMIIISDAAVQMCSYEEVFWKFAEKLQEYTHTEVRFQ